MKHIKLICFLALHLPLFGSAQEGFKHGFIITANGEKVEGSIKQLFKSMGKLVFISPANKKITYAPSALKGFSIEGRNYFSYAYDFYEEILYGEKAGLYKKATDNRSEPIYNGPEVVGFANTTEGKRGDYYILTISGMKLDLITEKNFKDYFIRLINDNDSLSSKIKDGSLGYSQIKTVVKRFNE